MNMFKEMTSLPGRRLKNQAPSYKALVFLATALTGFAALAAQVVWQRELAILVGSEARSVSLTVAVFLFGLASGYFVFGKLTEKKWERFFLLKIYGYTELLTALYMGLFSFHFSFLKDFSFQLPAFFLWDILISLLALFLPTFLMGASLPVLTAVLPEKASEVSGIHAKIYGWNTLGASLGCLAAGFFFIPQWGFDLTLIIAAQVNFFAALVFVGNKLDGFATAKPDDFKPKPSRTPNRVYMMFVFLTGAVVIAFEVLFVRILNLSLGAGVYNFPMVLSLFVGALAWGSLSIKKRHISARFFTGQIFANIFCLGLVYMTAPYWSIWISHIRVSLSSIPSNYPVFRISVYLFLALFLVPAVFFMGRLLPLVYGLLRKTKKNYASVCGFLYFFNTLGTVFGTLVIGYFGFYIFDIDDLFRMSLFLLLSLAFVASFFEKDRVFMTVAIGVGLGLLGLPDWDRTGHYMGYFRDRKIRDWHFKGLFHLPKVKIQDKQTLYFKDGPNSTVAFLAPKEKDNTLKNRFFDKPISGKDIQEESFPAEFQSWAKAKESNYSMIVNGKSDGDTKGDFSTVVLLGSLPYLFAPARENLRAAVVGLGTGFTAALMGRMKDIKETVVLEISPKAILGIQKISAAGWYNFGLTNNPRVRFVERDAFRYFAKNRLPFDIIVSEPSNPWVVGVENLFSLEFYRLVSKSLSDGGVLSQWLHTYSLSREALEMIVKTLTKEFPYVEMYRIHDVDIAFLASHRPLTFRGRPRFKESRLQIVHKALGIKDASDISLLQTFSSDRLSKVSRIVSDVLHTLENPKLTYKADKAFFLGRSVNPQSLAPLYISEERRAERNKQKALLKYEKQPSLVLAKQCAYSSRFAFYCRFLKKVRSHQKLFKNKKESVSHRKNSYNFLRSRGLIAHQPEFLDELKADFLNRKVARTADVLNYTDHLLSQKLFHKVHEDMDFLKQKGLLSESSFQFMTNRIRKIQSFYEGF